MTGPDQTPEVWNAASEAYDAKIWNLMTPWVDEMISRAAPKPEDDVLDVAAGSGAVAVAIAPKVRRVLAVDFASDMIERLRRRAKDANLDNVEAEVMDGQALTLEDGTFDIVTSNFGAIFFPDRVKGFTEMRRVLRPSGRAVISSASAPERFQLFGLFLAAARAALPDMPQPPEPPPLFSLADPNRFEDELKAAGFGEVGIETVSHVTEIESADALWNIVSSSTPPTVALLKKVGPEGAARVRTMLDERIRERFGDEPIRLTMEAHIAVASQPSGALML